MKILITGANGFIAREIILKLVAAGHEIVACVKKPSDFLAQQPGITQKIINFNVTTHSVAGTAHIRAKGDEQIHFNDALSPTDWLPLLDDVDVVINCVGIFHATDKQAMWNIHCYAPQALYKACQQKNIKKIIHLSALGIDKIDCDYANSKLAIEKYLRDEKLPAIIIRPSFVYGRGSHGGSSLFRGLAGLPGMIVTPGRGEQLLQPIFIEDLAQIVVNSLTITAPLIINAVGKEQISIKNVLKTLRQWLGFGRALTIAVPLFMLSLAAKFFDHFNNSPMSSTGIKMLAIDNISSTELKHIVGFTPSGFKQKLSELPCYIQDQWHARLYFLAPVLRVSLALLWIYTAIISIITAKKLGFPLLQQTGIPAALQGLLLYASSAINFLLGLALLIKFKVKLTALLQIILVVAYTIIISAFLPAFWLHPFAPIAKNIPIIVATLIVMLVEEQ